MQPDTNYWIVVASRDHGQRGVREGIVQANHGKRAALDRMRPGDRLAIYSPREEYGKPGQLQAFTALATVSEGPVWQADMGNGFLPFRRKVEYEPVVDAPLLPLLDRLTFIRNKTSYGAVFRFGVIRIPREDFDVIESALRATGAEE